MLFGLTLSTFFRVIIAALDRLYHFPVPINERAFRLQMFAQIAKSYGEINYCCQKCVVSAKNNKVLFGLHLGKEVRLRPVLWDRKHKLYRNKLYRDAAWTEILMRLSPEYDSWNEEQRADADKKIQQRWRTARDTYKKEKMYQHARQGNKKRIKYSLSEKLKFLDNDGTTTDTDEIDDVVIYENIPIESNEGILQHSPPPDPLTQESKLNSTVNEYGSSQFEVPFLERVRTSGSELEIEDLAFFQSLQPSLESFTRQQKLMFRSRVLNILIEMENQVSVKTEIIN